MSPDLSWHMPCLLPYSRVPRAKTTFHTNMSSLDLVPSHMTDLELYDFYTARLNEVDARLRRTSASSLSSMASSGLYLDPTSPLC
jgi:hypothetical protein